MKSGRILAHKNMLFFSHDKQNARGMCDVNERQSNPQQHEDWSVGQRRKTRPLWLMWPST